jgi:Ni/Co efflux regulator RcnB
MKKLLLSAAALVILSAPAAIAQDQNNDNQPKQERANRGDKPDRAGDNQMNGPSGGMQGPGHMGGPNAKDRDNNNKDRDANDNNNRDRDNNNANDRNNGPDKKVVVHKTVDRSVILKVRANITAPRKFHAARAYVRPAGWYEHRWTYGERLPRNFFVSDFWITDFGVYGLIAPWDGYEWVRYGDDALLIDVDTGEVIRVEYGLFY